MLNDLFRQFKRDLKKSWQKTALLAVLFVVGLCIWVPPLVGSFVESEADGAAVQPAVSLDVVGSDEPKSEVAAGRQSPFSWVAAVKLLERDSTLKSIEVAAIEGDPFHVDFDQFPPPVLFAEEPPKPKGPGTGATGAGPKVVAAPSNLVLKSTIVGSRRRAAYINDQLCFEGHEVELEGITYRLTAVEPRRITMTRGTDLFELEIQRAGGEVRSQTLASPASGTETPPLQ